MQLDDQRPSAQEHLLRSWRQAPSCVSPAPQLKREWSLLTSFGRANGNYHDISNTWLAHGYLSSSPLTPGRQSGVRGRLIGDAFAVRERRGDPRGFRAFAAHSFLNMPSSLLTPGSSIIASVQNFDVDVGLRRDLSGSALPILPQSVSRGHVGSCARPSRWCRTARPYLGERWPSRLVATATADRLSRLAVRTPGDRCRNQPRDRSPPASTNSPTGYVVGIV
jgi:hypothetical protein